jgi:hypothetical protein
MTNVANKLSYKINNSTNTHRAKVNIIDTPIKDLVALGYEETEINTTRILWDKSKVSYFRSSYIGLYIS